MKKMSVFFLFLVFATACAQNPESKSQNYFHYKSIRIINGDTTIEEKTITGNEPFPDSLLKYSFVDSLFTMKFNFGYNPFHHNNKDPFFDDLDSLFFNDFFRSFNSPFPRFKTPFFDDFFDFPDIDRYFRNTFPDVRNNYKKSGKIYIENQNNKFSIEGLEVKIVEDKKAINVQLPVEDKTITLQIIDNSGNILFKESIEKISGLYSRQIPLDNFKAGNYELYVIKGNKTDIVKFRIS